MCSTRSQAAPGTTITSLNLKTLFSGTDSFGDPHCIYNPYVRRWIVTGYQQVSGGRSLTPIAISATDVPGGAGTWTTYRVPSWDGSAIAGLTGCNTVTPVRRFFLFFLFCFFIPLSLESFLTFLIAHPSKIHTVLA